MPFSPRQMKFFETELNENLGQEQADSEEAGSVAPPDALEIQPHDTTEERRMKEAGSLLLNHIKSQS